MIRATMQNLRKYAEVKGVMMYSPITGEQYSATPGDYFTAPENHKFVDREGNPLYLVIPAASHADIVNADLSFVIDRAMKGSKPDREYLSDIWDGESWESIKKKLDTEGSVWVVWYEDGLREHARRSKIKTPKKSFYQPSLKPRKRRSTTAALKTSR